MRVKCFGRVEFAHGLRRLRSEWFGSKCVRLISSCMIIETIFHQISQNVRSSSSTSSCSRGILEKRIHYSNVLALIAHVRSFACVICVCRFYDLFRNPLRELHRRVVCPRRHVSRKSEMCHMVTMGAHSASVAHRHRKCTHCTFGVSLRLDVRHIQSR